MSKRMTAAFELDVRTLGVNPLKVETPFGPPVTVSDGDEFERADALEARIAELEEALRFYADRNNHTVRYASEAHTRMKQDLGERARTALKETDQ